MKYNLIIFGLDEFNINILKNELFRMFPSNKVLVFCEGIVNGKMEK